MDHLRKIPATIKVENYADYNGKQVFVLAINGSFATVRQLGRQFSVALDDLEPTAQNVTPVRETGHRPGTTC